VIDRRVALAALAAMLAGFAVAVAVPAGSGWDFANFYDAGRRAAGGHIAELYRPEAPIGGEAPQGRLAYWGLPVTAWFFAPLAAFPPGVALVLFKLQNVAAYLAAFALLLALGRRFAAGRPWRGRPWRYPAVFALLCLVYQPFWSAFRVGGQTTPTVLLLVAVALAAHLNGGAVVAGVAWALVVAVKPALVFGLALLALLSGWRFRLAAGGTLAGLGLLSLATAPWATHLEFLAKMREGAGRFFPWVWNSALSLPVAEAESWWQAHGASPPPEVLFTAATLALQATVIAAVAAVVVAARRRDLPVAARRHLHHLLAILFFLLFSRTVWEHYLALLFVVLAHLVAVAGRLAPGARATVAAIFVACLGQNVTWTTLLRPHLALDGLGMTLAVALAKCLPLVLTLFFLLHYRGEWLASYHHPPWEDLGAADPARGPRAGHLAARTETAS
jgi:Glycosyltransferase family 87